MSTQNTPLARLRHHVAGAIERGEAEAVAGILCPATLYRSYLNEFITVDRFAEFYGFSRDEALALISMGREMHEAGVARAKGVQS